jgi:hypothetical protein
MNPPRICSLCDVRIKFKERLCPAHKEEYKDHLTEPWMCAIIEYASYEYTLLRRDTKNHVRSLDTMTNI